MDVPDAADEREMPDEQQDRLVRRDDLFWLAFGVGWLWVPLGLTAAGWLAERAGVPRPVVGAGVGAAFLGWVAFVIILGVRLVFGVRCPGCGARLRRGRRPREFSRRGRWLYPCGGCGVHWDSGIRPQDFTQPNG